MKKNPFKLEDIIEADKFQKIQDDIAKATDMSLLTVDYKGIPFTGHSQCQEHCILVRQLPQYRDLCQKCDSRGGLEAARLQAPYIYLCHQGLVDLAVPIIVDGQYLGAMMAGQVLLQSAAEEAELEKIASNKLQLVDEPLLAAILKARNQLPRMSLEKVQAIASMLFHINQYIVEEAVLKALLTQQDDEKMAADAMQPSAEQLCEANRIEGSSTMTLDQLIIEKLPKGPKSELILPALRYLQTHVEDRLYVDQMALLCNVSASYFSKCFNQVTGTSFSAYHNALKIKKAELLLQTSNKTVNQLSDELGFDNPGYFIKIFRHYQGMTPAVYRQRFQSKQAVESHHK